MVESYTEREDKFDVTPAWALPEVRKALPDGAVVAVDTLDLTSEYFDTDDRALLAFGATLRRRSGDADTGWHLKLPAGAARRELKLPLSAARVRVPKKLATLVIGIARGQELRPLATLHTLRTTYRWVDADGVLLVEIADDKVRAIAPGPHCRRSLGVARDRGGARTRRRREAARCGRAGAAGRRGRAFEKCQQGGSGAGCFGSAGRGQERQADGG